jgi:two-component system cell cycle response regulator
MQAVRPGEWSVPHEVEQARPSHRSVPDFGDDEVTEIVSVRSTDFGGPPPAPVTRDRALLLRMDGVQAGQVFPLAGAGCTIGRGQENALTVDDPGISRTHARIVHDGVAHVLEDLQSRNGTFVQGHRIVRCRLSEGDWVQLGPRVGFRYSVVDARQQSLLQQLYESSTRDALTGAYNRKHFDERLRAELAYAARHQTETSLVLLDIDHFKKINDQFGHPAGDTVLRQVARLVAQRLRAEDLFCRIGGEEFAVILRGIDLVGATRVAERLRTTVGTVPTIVSGRPIPVTISLGCASLACCATRGQSELVAVADRRLYGAKHAGRNRVIASD